MHPTPFGRYIRDSRVHGGKSLRSVAEALGVSHAYLAEVERGKRRVLPERYWDDFCKYVPGVTRVDLADRAERSSELHLDLAQLEPSAQDVALQLCRRIKTQELSGSSKLLADLLRILGDDDE